MDGWQWALILPAAGLVVRGFYIAFTGRKATNVTWVNGRKYVEHEEPRTGRGLGATLCFIGAAVFVAAMTRSPIGEWARSGLKLQKTAEDTYYLWAWRLFGPLVIVFLGVFVVLAAVFMWDALRDRAWDSALILAIMTIFVSATTGYVAWYWWGLVT